MSNPDISRRRILAGAPAVDAPVSMIVKRVTDLKLAWENAPTGPTKADEQALRDYMAVNFDAPARELEAMRPATVADALAKVRFYRWFAEAVASDEPYERGLRIVADDLAALDGMSCAAVTDDNPDEELRRLWAEAIQLQDKFDHEPFSGPEEERQRQYEHLIAALHAAFAAEAQTVAGLSIKLQQIVNVWADNCDADRQSDLISTAYAAVERLAPGSVIYRPAIENISEGDEA